jgi:hypothetical protein
MSARDRPRVRVNAALSGWRLRQPIVVPKKIAFYPCCASDIGSARRLLKGFVDTIIFCDINSKLSRLVAQVAAEASEPDLPEVRAMIGDASQVLERLETIDVLFYRRDSDGEGGSGIYVLGDAYMRRLLPHFPPEGGLIITDGSNQRGGWFRKMKRKRGFAKYGWRLAQASDQPLESEGLAIITVAPDLFAS